MNETLVQKCDKVFEIALNSNKEYWESLTYRVRKLKGNPRSQELYEDALDTLLWIYYNERR